MSTPSRFATALLLAGPLLPAGALAQAVAANYALTAPAPLADTEAGAVSPLLALGPLRLAGGMSGHGSGLSLEAGRQWFARVGVGRSLADETLSLGGGYRFSDTQSLSMQFTRRLSEERLGLAVRYDWSSSWLRLSYEVPRHAWTGSGDMLRFSAGLRF